MKLHTIVFDDSPVRYHQFAAVLARSVEANSPSTPLTIHVPKQRDRDLAGTTHYRMNARKARHHARIVREAEKGETLGLLDADTMVLRDLSDVHESMHCNLQYTLKPDGAKYDINSGVLFVRVSDVTREFFARWERAAMLLLAYKEQLSALKPKHGGINQCALGLLLTEEHANSRMVFTALPCAEWNACSDSLDTALDQARIVHILSDLRRCCLNNHPSKDPRVDALARKWRSYAV